MLHSLKFVQVAAINGLASLLALALALAPAPALSQAVGRMSLRSVAVTTNGPVINVEAIHFLGSAIVTSRLASDAEFGSPSLIMQFDLAGVTGTGAQSGTRYVLDTQEHVVRPHRSSQNVEFVFPMPTDPNAPIATVRIGTARFVMNVDLATGLITSINASLTPR